MKLLDVNLNLIRVIGVISVLFTSSLLVGQKVKTDKKERPGENNSAAKAVILETLIVRTRSAAPEVKCDVLLSLVASNLIADKNRKMAMLEEVFQTAKQLREPVKRKNWGVLVDTRNGYKQMAYDMKLDQLSIRSRVVQSLVSLDRVKARNLYREIEIPTPVNLTCEDSFNYDLSVYYEATWAIADKGFTIDERKIAQHIQFLIERIAEVNSLPQLLPVLKFVAETKFTSDEFSSLIGAVVKAFSRVARDARSFAFAVEKELAISYLQRILMALKEQNLPALEFERAAKGFLTNGFKDAVCSDVGWLKNRQAVMPESIRAFNEVLSAPISEDDIRPAEVKGKARDVIYWRTTEGRQLLSKLKFLRFGGSSKELSVEYRHSEKWQQDLAEFISFLDIWEPPKELADEDDYFQQKCAVYVGLLDLCPEDIALHNSILFAYTKYLKETNQHYKGSIDWLWHAKHYLQIINKKNEAERSLHLKAWRNSGDDTLWVYGELSSLLTTK